MSKTTIIRWLKLLPQRKLFAIFSLSSIGKIHSEDNGANLIIKTASYGYYNLACSKIIQDWKRHHHKLQNKFNFPIFLKFIFSVPNDSSDQFLVFDFKCVRDLIFEYTSLIHLLNLWTWVDKTFIPFCMHFLIFTIQRTSKLYLNVFLSSVMRNADNFAPCLSVYNVKIVCSIFLKYYTPTTTITRLGLLPHLMPRLIKVESSFGKLHVDTILKKIGPRLSSCTSYSK